MRGGRCVDFDECSQIGICDQICTNNLGNYRCDCYPGYQLTQGVADQKNEFKIWGTRQPHKCRATGPDPMLLLANRATIRQYDMVTNKYKPLITKLESVVAMDYWHKNKVSEYITLHDDGLFLDIVLVGRGQGTNNDVQNRKQNGFGFDQ